MKNRIAVYIINKRSPNQLLYNPLNTHTDQSCTKNTSQEIDWLIDRSIKKIYKGLIDWLIEKI